MPMADRRCKKIFAALSEYLDGKLPVRNCRELEKHLRGCAPCFAYLETLKSTIEACRNFPTPKAPPPSPRVRQAMMKTLRQKAP